VCTGGHINSTFTLGRELSLDLTAMLSVHDHRDGFAGNSKLVRVFATRPALEGMCGMTLDAICALCGDDQLKVRESLVDKAFKVTADVKLGGIIYIRAALPVVNS
jgi:hypothetical protein